MTDDYRILSVFSGRMVFEGLAGSVHAVEGTWAGRRRLVDTEKRICTSKRLSTAASRPEVWEEEI